jgi:tetratricopeptide (TPR) repeat protein
MIQLIFSLRFQSQLRRTRNELIQRLEKTIADTVKSFGGTVRVDHKLISATFSGQTTGFAMDMLSLIESIKKALDKVSSELYGHTCILGREIPEEHIPELIRSLPSQRRGTGIWCDSGLRTMLESFIDFEEFLTGDYAQIRTIRRTETAERETTGAEKIYKYLTQSSKGNILIIGPGYPDDQEGITRYCREAAQNFPPLVIRFSLRENAVRCLTDALTPEIQEKLTKNEMYTELIRLRGILFSERLKTLLPEFIIKQGMMFFSLFLESYRLAAEQKGCKPFMVLENTQHANPFSSQIIKNIYRSFPQRARITVYGTAKDTDGIKNWDDLFPRIAKFAAEKIEDAAIPVLPLPVWEIAYCCALYCRYFPAFLLPQLLEEEGKNPAVIEKSLALFTLIELRDPRFIPQAEEILGNSATAIRTVVRNRLLAWVEKGLLKPCFGLLEVLFELGGTENGNLILDAISSEMANENCQEFENAVQNGSFAAVVGKEWENILLGILKVQTILNNGDKNGNAAELEQSLSGVLSVPSSPISIPVAFKVRIFTNAAAYYLGIAKHGPASEAVKKAMLLAQDENQGSGLARIYRLFSLVEFTSRRLPEAIDYFGFSMEEAEKSGEQGELGIAAYYAAVVHFVFGNISKAKLLAIQAQEAALAAVLPGWVDKSRFLKGRLCFETGGYEEALHIFIDLKKNPLGPETEQFKQTLTAWIYRAGSYLGKAMPKKSTEPDAELFEIEAAFLSCEYKKVIELSGAYIEKPKPEQEFIIIEQPDWSSGFSQCELLLFSSRDFQNRMIHTFRTLAMCRHISGKANYDREGAIQDLEQIMRDELSEMDPNDAFYFYAYYRFLKDTGAPEVDMNTAISIAFKRLQKRASRIDDNETKRAFLSQNRWNNALSAAAKEHNLI